MVEGTRCGQEAESEGISEVLLCKYRVFKVFCPLWGDTPGNIIVMDIKVFGVLLAMQM